MGISALRWSRDSGADGAHGVAGLRAARAAVFAALCVTLSTGAHVLLSGAPLPLPAVAAVAAVVFALAFVLAGGGPRRFAPIAALLLPLQLAADTVFTAGQSSCYGPGGGPVTGPLRVLGVDVLCGGGEFGGSLAGLGHAPVESAAWPHPAAPWLLLVAHLLVGLAGAAWLSGGDAGLSRLLCSAAAATLRPLLVAVAALGPFKGAEPAAGAPPAERRHPPALVPVLLCHSVVRRGPPRRLALAH